MPSITEISREFAREDLEVYATVQWPGYQCPPHIREVLDALQAVERGECKRLIISMPPRYGKSETCAGLFPAWYLGKHPDDFFIYTTYGEDLSLDFGKKVRDYIDSPQHYEIFPDCNLAPDSSASKRFTIAGKRGAYYAVGRGGPITGRGAAVLLIDDPYKDYEEAASETIRQQLKTWYQTVAYTRLMPGAAIIIITTRWHVDDLPGWILSEPGLKDQGWWTISFPAIAESEETIGGKTRHEGEALWPERYPLEYLQEVRSSMEAHLWLALFQQKPTIGGGYKFRREWWKEEAETTDQSWQGMNRYLLVDPANSKKKTSDSTVMWIVGLGQDGNYHLLDGVKDRLSLYERIDALFALHRKWRPSGVGYERYGKDSDIDAIKKRMEETNYHFEVTELGGRTAKADRIGKLEPLWREGKLWVPKHIWYSDRGGVERDLAKDLKEQEFVKFPAVKHDDMLDCLARIIDPKLSIVWPMAEEFHNLNNVYPMLRRKRRSWMAA